MKSTVGPKFLKHLMMICKCSALPVAKSRETRWMYRKVPKVSSLRKFGKIPLWCRKPQSFTYYVCAEDTTRGGLVSTLSAEERDALLNRGELPPDSSAKGPECVMCPVRLEYPKLIP